MVRSLALLFGATLTLTLTLAAGENWLAAPVPSSPPVNQLRTDGNACGPACLVDAFRSGGPKWRASIAQIKGSNDAARVKNLILQYGRKGSRLDPARYRWNGRFGINATDLTDIANELRSERWMRKVKAKVLFRDKGDTPEELLQETHQHLSASLKRKLPPILGIRRVAWRSPKGTSIQAWLTVKRHFVVLTGLPAKLPRDATSFPVTYHDPWGGKKFRGTIRIPGPKTQGLPTLVADFPNTTVGQSSLQKEEASCLSLSSAIGLF